MSSTSMVYPPSIEGVNGTWAYSAIWSSKYQIPCQTWHTNITNNTLVHFLSSKYEYVWFWWEATGVHMALFASKINVYHFWDDISKLNFTDPAYSTNLTTWQLFTCSAQVVCIKTFLGVAAKIVDLQSANMVDLHIFVLFKLYKFYKSIMTRLMVIFHNSWIWTTTNMSAIAYCISKVGMA